MELYENDLVKILKKEGGLPSIATDFDDVYRVLYVDHENDYLWWVHIFDDSLPEEKNISDIELMISKGGCELYTSIDPWDKYPDIEVYDSDTVGYDRLSMYRRQVVCHRKTIPVHSGPKSIPVTRRSDQTS